MSDDKTNAARLRKKIAEILGGVPQDEYAELDQICLQFLRREIPLELFRESITCFLEQQGKKHSGGDMIDHPIEYLKSILRNRGRSL